MAGNAHKGISSALTSALSGLVHEAIVLADARGRIVLASALAQRLLGRQQKDLAGVPLSELMPDFVPAEVEALAPNGEARPAFMSRRMDIAGELAPVEVALTRVPDGGVIALALSIRRGAGEDRAGADAAVVRYGAFLSEISRFVGRSDDAEDGIDGVSALIAAALEVRAVAVVVLDGHDEPQMHLHDFPESIVRALLECFAWQPGEGDRRAHALPDLAERQQPFASAVRRAEFRDAVVVDLSTQDRHLGWLSTLSKQTGRFDPPAQEFLGRAASILARAIAR